MDSWHSGSWRGYRFSHDHATRRLPRCAAETNIWGTITMGRVETMTIMQNPTTNTASTRDWLRATKDMTISAYDPKGGVMRETEATETTEQFEVEKDIK